MSARSLFGPGTFVLGGGAIILLALLVIGFFLPSTWEASADRLLDAEADSLLTYLDSPEGWRLWTTWPDSTMRTGPERGEGATMAWATRELGAGTFRIDAAAPDRVTYSVEVGGVGGSLTTSGTIRLTPEAGGTRLSWSESGDLGPNPLMGWWGLTMERSQSRELGKSLDQLESVLAGRPAFEPDTLSTSGSAPSR